MLDFIIPKLQKLMVGIAWYIWEDLRESDKEVEGLSGYMDELDDAYRAGDKQRFEEIVVKALEAKSDG